MDEKLQKLTNKIAKQGKIISKLKNEISSDPMNDNEYKRLIDRIQVSENELVMQVEELNQENKELKDVFTEENLRRLITSYSKKDEYPTYEIEIVEDKYVEVTIYAKGENADNVTENIFFEFVEMSDVLVVS